MPEQNPLKHLPATHVVIDIERITGGKMKRNFDTALTLLTILFGIYLTDTALAESSCAKLSKMPVGSTCITEAMGFDREFRRVRDAYTKQLGILDVEYGDVWLDAVAGKRNYSEAEGFCANSEGKGLPSQSEVTKARERRLREILPGPAQGMFWGLRWEPVDNELWDKLIVYDAESFVNYELSRYETYRQHNVRCVARLPMGAETQTPKKNAKFTCQFRPAYSGWPKPGQVEFDMESRTVKYKLSEDSNWEEFSIDKPSQSEQYPERSCRRTMWANLGSAKSGTEAVIHSMECHDYALRSLVINRFGDQKGELDFVDLRLKGWLTDCKVH